MKIKKRAKVFAASKAQITIFMIIAVTIMLFGLAYFVYQKQLGGGRKEVVQPELVPVKAYVENCMASIAKDGLERIGMSGGYIKIPASINKNPKAALAMFPSSDFKIPYWWHDGITAIPSIESINQELKNYVQDGIKECINNFEPFAQQYKITELENPSVKVSFNDEDTAITAVYPLEIIAKSGSFSAGMQNFEYSIPIRFKKVYDLAKLIMERENKDYFLEQKTMDLMSMDTEIPTTDIEATCRAKKWQLEDIKSKLKELLMFNLPYVRIAGTDYNPGLYVPNPAGKNIYSDTYYNYHYIWELELNPGNKYSKMKVAFKYDGWPMQIYARPSENGVLKSNAQQGTDMLKFVCLHVWHFTYDIDYPVMASIFDQPGDLSRRYHFNFPFMVSINHNKPSRSNKGTTVFDNPVDMASEDYCMDTRNEITVYTFNNATGEPLSEVNLTFVCGKFSCGIGPTDYVSYGAAAGSTIPLPYCVYGIIKGARNGFSGSSEFIQTDVSGRTYTLFMNPLKEFKNYRIVKHPVSNPSAEDEAGPNEKAIIYFTSNLTSFESYAYYPKEADFPIQLPSGKDNVYEVNIYIADDETLVGGYSGEWKISKDELESADEIVFHTIVLKSASEDERAAFVAGLSSYSKSIPQPELRKAAKAES